MKQSLSLALLVAASVSGCGTLRGAGNALDERPRQPYGSPNLEAARDLMPVVRDFTYALAAVDVPNCRVSRPVAQRRQDVQPYGGQAPTVSCTRPAPIGVSIADIDQFLNSSIFIIDANCSAYLDSLSNLGDSSRWTRSQVNTIANYVGVLMALAGQPSEDLGYLNAATGFFNASAENLDTFVLISPTPGKLTPLVRTAQADLRLELDAIRIGDARLRWSSSARWVEQYAALCTPRGIRSLLDEAIDDVTIGDSAAELVAAADRAAPVVVETLQGLGAFSGNRSWISSVRASNRLGAIAWRIQPGSALTDEQKTFIQNTLGADLNRMLEAAIADPAQNRVLQQMVAGVQSGAFTELRRGAETEWASESARTRLARAQSEATDAVRAAENAQRETDRLGLQITELKTRLRAAGIDPDAPAASATEAPAAATPDGS